MRELRIHSDWWWQVGGGSCVWCLRVSDVNSPFPLQDFGEPASWDHGFYNPGNGVFSKGPRDLRGFFISATKWLCDFNQSLNYLELPFIQL